MYNFLRFCFFCPILILNIHFLSRRIVFECIENVEISITTTTIPVYFQGFKNYGTFLKEFGWLNYVIIYHFEELIYKLKKEFQYYLFSNILKKTNFFFYELYFYKKECNETFIKYLYFVFWLFIELFFIFSLKVKLYYCYTLVFFTIFTCFYFF